MKRSGLVAFGIIYLAFGVYFLRDKLITYELPEKLLSLDPWFLLIGGALLIISGVRFLFAKATVKSTVRYKVK